jgi:hypothetical protein
VASLLLPPLLMMRKDGPRWVGAAVPAGRHCLRFVKVSTVASPSSAGLEGGVFGALSVDTRSAHVVGHSDASDVVVLVTGSVSAVRALLLLVLALRRLGLVLRSLVLLASGVALRPLTLVAPRRL